MTQRTLRAAAIPFAHLIPGYRAAKADEPGDKDPKDPRGKRAEEPDPEDENDDPPAPGEGVDGDPVPDLGDVEDPDDSLDEDAAPEEDDSDPKVRKAAKSGRKAENARWTKVMQHSASAGRVAAACQLLSTTRASAKSVIGTLAALPAAQAPAASTPRDRLDDRMASRPNAKVGADAPAGADDFGRRVAAAVGKVRRS